MVILTACGGSSDSPVTASDDASVTIEGRVVGPDGTPLAGAEVLVHPVSIASVTDGNGRYAFTLGGLSAPAFVLEVRLEGYEPTTRQVIVAPGGSLRVDVTLVPILPEPEPEPTPVESDISVTSSSVDEVGCIAPGVVLGYVVAIGNPGPASEIAVVLHDTLDALFGRALMPSDIVIDRSRFPDAVVVLNPDGRSFAVEIGIVPSMAQTPAYTVSLPAGPQGPGVYCNRVTAAGTNGIPLDRAHSCVTNTLAIEIGLVNEDGAIVGGAFTSEPEVFHVGDGDAGRPNALVFRVVVENRHCGSHEDVSLTSLVGSRSGGVEFREFLPGFPDRGAVEATAADGFVWSIGTLAGEEQAEIRFRAEAVQPGVDIHRVVLTLPAPVGEIINEEPITILP